MDNCGTDSGSAAPADESARSALPGEILEAPDAAAASFYISSDGNVMAVDVNISGVFRAGIPKPLFKLPAGVRFAERFAGLQAVSDVCSLKHGRTLTTSVQPCGEPAIAPAEMTPGTKLGRYEILASACRNQIFARTVRS